MPRKCLVCESQHLKAIDKALVDNESHRNIAKRFDLNAAAVYRHKTNHLPKLMIKAKDAETVVHASSLMNRVEKIMARCELIAETSTKAGDWTPAIAASRELRGCLELLGKLSGEIQTGTKVGILNVAGASAVPNFRAMSDSELRQFLETKGHPLTLEAQNTTGDNNERP